MAVAEHIPEAIVREARERRPLSEIARSFVALKKAGSEWAAPCPFHNEKTPSFFVNDRKGFYHCFGCGAHGDAIALLMQLGCRSFHDAVAELRNVAVSYDSAAGSFLRRQREATAEFAEAPGRFDGDADDRARAHEARAIWRNRAPLKGSLAERYLLERRRLLKPFPDCLAFAPSLYFAPAHRERPALIAALHDARGDLCAVQRIYLDPETADKADPRRDAKRTKGPMRDGAVRLGDARKILGIAEGVETGLAAKSLYSLPVWASLGAQRMKSVKIPAGVDEVMIFRDNGDVGKREAIAAAEAYEAVGCRVMIEAPPAEFGDWNDVVKARRG